MSYTAVDFKGIFEQSPGNYVVVGLDYQIVAVTDGYRAMTNRTREELVGMNIFEAFPDDPNDPDAKGTTILRAGLEQALDTQRTEWLPGAQRYPIPRSNELGGGFEERWFRAVNAPVIDDDGAVRFLIHGNEDVTEQMTSTT